MNTADKNRTILKFDVGADGFFKMIIVLAITALIVVAIGLYFIIITTHEIKALS